MDNFLISDHDDATWKRSISYSVQSVNGGPFHNLRFRSAKRFLNVLMISTFLIAAQESFKKVLNCSSDWEGKKIFININNKTIYEHFLKTSFPYAV